jgi:hypothetical protein
MSNLKEKAISLGLCQDFQNEWESKDLLKMYLAGVSWCMERKYPSLEDMRPYKLQLEDLNVFNERRVDLLLTAPTYVLNECYGVVEILDWNVSRLYISRDSIVRVIAKDNTHIMIDCYDNSNIQIAVSDNAKVVVNQYGNSSVQVLNGKAKINKR